MPKLIAFLCLISAAYLVFIEMYWLVPLPLVFTMGIYHALKPGNRPDFDNPYRAEEIRPEQQIKR